MPDASEPPAARPQGAHARDTRPLFLVDSLGERVGIAAMLVLILGALLPWGHDSLAAWGPLSLSGLDLVPLSLAVLTLLQLLSPGGKLGDLVMLGVASVAGLGATAAQASQDALQGALGAGLPVTLLGSVLGLGAMELVRREAGLDYARIAQRALELLTQPRVLLALLKLALPFALAGGFVLAVLEVDGEAVASKLGIIFASYFFNPLGKEVAIPLALSSQPVPPALDPALSWTFIVLIDLCTALFLVWNFDWALRVPFFGRMLGWVERRGHAAVERYKWIRRLAFFGLVLYATLPLEGTGAIGGSVVGRAIGLSPFRTFLAVVVGSIIRTTYITLFALGVLSALHL